MKLKTELGKLLPVYLRDVFADEAKDFTPWLAQQENLNLLGETIGLNLQCEQEEKSVGPYSADILCKDTATDNWVLIENQIEKTDHTHLGQLLTYAAGLEAVTIVWIARKFTDEHRAGLDWLNEHTDEQINFFGLEIELWRIGNSPVAPKFNIRCQPNDWSRAVKAAAGHGEISELGQLRLRFWTAFKEYMEKNSDSNIVCLKPAPRPYMDHPLDRAGIQLSSKITTLNSVPNSSNPEIRVALYLKGDHAQQHFAQLEAKKNEIEQSIGSKLIWHNPPGNRQCQIYLPRDEDFLNEKLWPQQHQWLKENLELFKTVFGPIVETLRDTE
jgi:hypothetical protein